MRAAVNDGLRFIIGFGIVCLGMWLALWHRLRRRRYRQIQLRLRRRFIGDADVPVSSFEDLRHRLEAMRGKRGAFARTSGSTAAPKRIFYTPRRLRRVIFAYVDMVCRNNWAAPIARKSLYIFSSLSDDDSLTAMMTRGSGAPPYVATLQAPYRAHNLAAARSLRLRYGDVAVRLFILTLADPGTLYATNPSTLTTFFDALANNWRDSTALMRDYLEGKKHDAHCLVRRLASNGWRQRFEVLVASSEALPVGRWAPSVSRYVCWTGGYVQPFLDRLENYLPSSRYARLPMYSMSTEVIETVTDFSDGVRFLPMAPGVLYEFLPDGARDQPSSLVAPWDLEVSGIYSMVVSDPHGLLRYQTGDLFECRGHVGDAPDLAFLRRRELEYSFTGEKLTALQLDAVYRELRRELDWLGDSYLTCVPSLPQGAQQPRYRVLVLDGRGEPTPEQCATLAQRADVLLKETNGEYRSKRDSDRLAPVDAVAMTPAAFAMHIGGGAEPGGWETQFKFLPLYRRLWEHSHSSGSRGGSV